MNRSSMVLAAVFALAPMGTARAGDRIPIHLDSDARQYAYGRVLTTLKCESSFGDVVDLSIDRADYDPSTETVTIYSSYRMKGFMGASIPGTSTADFQKQTMLTLVWREQGASHEAAKACLGNDTQPTQAVPASGGEVNPFK